jgi:hypothetical protein
MAISRSDEYRRMLRWYPASWRAQYEDAVVATLLDQADARGDTGPTIGDRFAMAVGGLRKRFASSGGRRVSVVLPLAVATGFSLFYFSMIAWSPGVRYPGALGPFTNPSIAVGVLVVVALVLALAGRDAVARSIALMAAGTEMAIATLAGIFDWLGPSLPTAVLVAGLCVIAALPWNGRIAAAVSLAVLAALSVFLSGMETVRHSGLGLDFLAAGLEALVLGGVAIAVGIAARRATRFEQHLGRA